MIARPRQPARTQAIAATFMALCLAVLTTCITHPEPSARPHGDRTEVFRAFVPRPGSSSSPMSGSSPRATQVSTRSIELVDFDNRDAAGALVLRFDRDLCPGAVGQADVADLTATDASRAGNTQLAGHAVWRTASVLAFEATSPWPPATTVAFRLGGRLCQGVELSAPDVLRLTPRPLEVHIVESSLRLDGRDAIELHTSLPVETASLVDALSVNTTSATDTSPTPMLVAVTQPDRSEPIYEIVPTRPWPANATVRVLVQRSLRSPEGPESLEAPATAIFNTWRTQHIAIDCEQRECDTRRGLVFRLHNGYDKDARRRIRVQPAIPNRRVTQQRHGEDSNDVVLFIGGDLTPSQPYAVTFPSGLVDSAGHRLETTQTFEITAAAPPPFLAFHHDALEHEYSPVVVLQANRPLHVGLVGYGVPEVTVKALAVPVGSLTEVLKQSDGNLARLASRDDWPTMSTTLPQTLSRSRFASTGLDLATLVGDRRGLFLVEARANRAQGQPRTDDDLVSRILVMITDLGLATTSSDRETIVRVASLASAAPVANAEVSVLWSGEGDGQHERLLGLTNASGLLSVASPHMPTATGVIVAREPGSEDIVFVESHTLRPHHPAADAIVRVGEQLIGSMTTERGLYAPGDTVHLFGWSTISSPQAKLGLRDLPQNTPLRISVRHTRYGELSVSHTKVGAHGKFYAALDLPKTAASGSYRVIAEQAGEPITSARFRVEDFRVPRFTAELARADENTGASAPPQDTYGPRQALRATLVPYSGEQTPVVSASGNVHCWYRRPPTSAYGLDDSWEVGVPGEQQSFDARLELADVSLSRPAADGRLSATLITQRPPSGRAASCRVHIALADASYQASSASLDTQVWPEGLALAVHPPRWGAARDRLRVGLRAVRLGGQRMAVRGVAVTVRDNRDDVVARCRVDVSARGRDRECRLPPLAPGSYAVEAMGPDGLRAATTIHVSQHPVPDHDDPVIAPARCERLAIGEQCGSGTPNADFSNTADTWPLESSPQFDWYRVGDRARIAISRTNNTPPATGVLLVSGASTSATIPFETRRRRHEVPLTISADMIPEAYVAAWRTTSGQSRRATFESSFPRRIQVSDLRRRLGVELTVPAHVRPGEHVNLGITVRDANGKPVSARVTMWSTDAAVLDLTSFRLPDLAPSPRAATWGEVFESYSNIVDPYVRMTAAEFEHGVYDRGSGAGFGSEGARVPGIHSTPRRPVRSKLYTTAWVMPDLEIGPDGTATVSMSMPDNLTEFRVFAVASASLSDSNTVGRYGQASAAIEVRSPVTVEAALPRTLRPGDRGQGAAIVRNNASTPAGYRVRVTTADPRVLALDPPPTSTVTVAANGQVRVPFSMVATRVGRGRVSVMLEHDGAVVDGETREIAIAHERLRIERDAIQGTITGRAGSTEAVLVPVALPGTRDNDSATVPATMQISVASNLLLGLDQAATSLIRYPHGCTEQVSSALVPAIVSATPGLAPSFADRVSPRQVADGIGRLLGRQRDDGSFGYWSKQSPVSPWASLQATWVLRRLSEAGYAVPSEAIARAERWVSTFLDDHDQTVPTRAMAFWIAAQSTQWSAADRSRLLSFVEEVTTCSSEQCRGSPTLSAALTLMAAHAADIDDDRQAALRHALMLRLRDGPAGTRIVTNASAELSEVFSSEVRDTAIALRALVAVAPTDPLNAKMVRWLLEQRRYGRWRNTQEDAMVMIALADFAQSTGLERGSSVSAEVWMNHEPVMAKDIGIRRVERSSRLNLGRRREHELVFAISGRGELHYEAVFERLRQASVGPQDRGLHLARTLRTIRGRVSNDVVAGDVVAIDIEIRADTPIHHVAVDLPLPAALEPILLHLPGVATTRPLPGEHGNWVTHEELRGDRVLLYADRLAKGLHVHTVYARATTPGDFSFPAGKAEAMYNPEVVGWSMPERLMVESPR